MKTRSLHTYTTVVAVRLAVVLALTTSILLCPRMASAASGLVISSKDGNDIYRMLEASGQRLKRFDTPAQAVEAADEGQGVLILADGYPQNRTKVDSSLFQMAADKRVRLYLEYPEVLPGHHLGESKTVEWERGVVTSDLFGAELEKLRILSPQNCVFIPVGVENSHLVIARVAGYDHAIYGLPQTTYPLLFEASNGGRTGAVLVATTKLSQLITARFGPVPAWQTVWRSIIRWASPDSEVSLQWIPTVHPAFTREDALPEDAESEALRLGVEWFHKSRLLIHPSRTNDIAQYAAGSGTAAVPDADAPKGDGAYGILEGYFSRILPDGGQLQSVSMRGDCTAESAAGLATGSKVLNRAEDARIATRLLDFWYFTSAARKGDRGDPRRSAFGLMAWGVGHPAWYVANYGDDNARLMLATMGTAAILKEDRWDEGLVQCLLANLRTAGVHGFRGDRIDMPELAQQDWEHFFRRRTVSYAPHFECYLWACYLWAYDKTGFELFRDRAENAIKMTMAAYPERWRWTNGIQQERARMLLALAWLVRVNDTVEHRGWLKRMADDLLAFQDPSGAIAEQIGAPERGMMHPPRSNDGYGLGESPLLQENGDPVSDMLYTCNFAFLGLHEAAAATDDAAYRQAADKLARFLCRIQVRSAKHQELDGAWFRAFDFRLWDYWASNADLGWGAWSIESGWTQGWITTVLGLRQMKTSLWDLTKNAQLRKHMDTWRPRMIPDEALARPLEVKVEHAGKDRRATLAAQPADHYSGQGAATLVDGLVGDMDHSSGLWLGFHQDNLEATVDLGTTTAISEIQASFLQNVRLGIFLPRKVMFFAGNSLSDLGQVHAENSFVNEKEPKPLRSVFKATRLNVRARYVRVVAQNMGKIPSWHGAGGQKAWLFSDEILINPVQAANAETRNGR